MTFQVSALSCAGSSGGEAYQITTLELPPAEVLMAIAQAVVLFAQLEHLLKIIHKRTDNTIGLDEVLDLRLSLGTILNGSNTLGKEVKSKDRCA